MTLVRAGRGANTSGAAEPIKSGSFRGIADLLQLRRTGYYMVAGIEVMMAELWHRSGIHSLPTWRSDPSLSL
jgi:hypothetical protein